MGVVQRQMLDCYNRAADMGGAVGRSTPLILKRAVSLVTGSLGAAGSVGVALTCLAASMGLHAQAPDFTYVPHVDATSVVVAWGTLDAFGRESEPLGVATVNLDGADIATVEGRNWHRFLDLDPDRAYGYCVDLGGSTSCGEVRTNPTETDALAFFVIGDFGEGHELQRQLGRVMASNIAARRATENPIRFVLTVGDNIYRDGNWFAVIACFFNIHCPGSGNEDGEWRSRFIEPYRDVIASVPFYPTPGNHDGSDSEETGDLAAYVDNFFLSLHEPDPRYYSLGVGTLVDFFAIDTTRNAVRGQPSEPMYAVGSAQDQWLRAALVRSQARWRIPYFHHPPLTAGPRHAPSDQELAHFMVAFETSGVQVVFTGHEHNLQLFRADEKTGGIHYVVTGAGGAVRGAEPGREGYTFRGIPADSLLEGWASDIHFLLVELDREVMTIDAYGTDGERIRLRGSSVELPVTIPLLENSR